MPHHDRKATDEMRKSAAHDLDQLRTQWQAAWPESLATWSRYVQLHEPIWCTSRQEEKSAGLTGSFAMIRLVDHSVVISLRQVAKNGLQAFAREILAHEIGHHVYCPADLADNARLLSRIRRGLPGVEAYAAMVSNLYSDLLINDHLTRSAELDIPGVYKAIESPTDSQMWLLYMRIYELLWRLPPNTLAQGKYDARLNQDAQLGARLVRSYARDWLGGAGRFACLCFPYVEKEQAEMQKWMQIWCDAIRAGAGGFPNGLADEDADEADGVIHPAEDPYLSGIGIDSSSGDGSGRVRSQDSGEKTIKSPRGPFEYAEILKATGIEMDDREIAARFYKERALPHLIPFPTRIMQQSVDTIPEGTEGWEVSEPLEEIDWWSTLLSSPEVIPGITTRKRLTGDSPGVDPDRQAIDLYLGVDCSGSMRDPALNMSYPILAGAVMVLSALRAGARVKVVLSGEPGSSIETDGFIRDPNQCLSVLTNYLGTGYAFGIHRLAETFLEDADKQPSQRPVHVLILSDHDMFTMLNTEGNGRSGWDVARMTIPQCRGGATYVLQLPGTPQSEVDNGVGNFGRMRDDGWDIHLVNSLEELVDFARQFSKKKYG